MIKNIWPFFIALLSIDEEIKSNTYYYWEGAYLNLWSNHSDFIF